MQRIISAAKICNLLTLRYDHFASAESTTLRDINPEAISQLRQSTKEHSDKIPSSIETEHTIRSIIRTGIEESGERHIAVALSSGVDSNVILYLIRKEFPKINLECITVTFDNDNSEATYARKLAESQNARIHEIHVENPLKDLPMLISIVKEPRWNVYQYYFIEKAKSISNVIFTGDGGDELFAGYTFRYKKFLENIRSNYSWEQRVHAYLLCHERDWVPDHEELFAGTQVKFSWSSIYQILRQYFQNNLEPLEQVLLADYHGKLMYDFIPTSEKFYKYFDIVGMAPLLRGEMIDLSMKIPAPIKYDFVNNVGKIQLREILKRNMDAYSDENQKIGFGMDIYKLWSRFGKELVISCLDRGRIFEDKIINRDWYHKSLVRIANGNNKHETTRYISKMLQLLSLEIWYKLFITNEISPISHL